MYTVYVLKSLKDNNLYIGCTSNIKNRIKYHNNGKVKSTKNRRPFIMIYSKDYDNIYKAYEMERYYKTAKGKKELKNILALSSNG